MVTIYLISLVLILIGAAFLFAAERKRTTLDVPLMSKTLKAVLGGCLVLAGFSLGGWFLIVK